LFEGEEAYFRDGGVAQLLKRYVSDKTLDYITFEGSAIKSNAAAFSAACAAYPFLSEKRLVRVTEWYPSEKEYEAVLKPLAENPAPDTILAVTNSAKQKTGAAKLSAKKGITVVDCARADESTLVKWIFLTLKRAGIVCDAETCAKVAEYCAHDMSRIYSETQKLLDYCAATGAERLTDSMAEEVVSPDNQYKIYELSNALASGDCGRFERIAAELFIRGFDETALLSSLVSYFRTLFEVSNAEGTEKEIAATLCMNEYEVKKTRRQAREFGKKTVERYYEYLFLTMGKIKSGALTPPAAFKEAKVKLLLGGA
ncbi:MAG: DNA polymerase III subunit delta, partial [Candidatus Borkfalkiaceae bacterium]|nr:DNA polymerase III subunit delta [Clostridia bacterium]MDY6222998.1 DNA polymerase III subunit delta [Christensenellaceae bacterium]